MTTEHAAALNRLIDSGGPGLKALSLALVIESNWDWTSEQLVKQMNAIDGLADATGIPTRFIYEDLLDAKTKCAAAREADRAALSREGR